MSPASAEGRSVPSRIAFSTLAFPDAIQRRPHPRAAAGAIRASNCGLSTASSSTRLCPEPKGFTLAARSLKLILNELGIPWR